MPHVQKKMLVRKLTANFRDAVSIETVPVCKPKEGEICVKNKYVGINTDDVNITKGHPYFLGNRSVPFEIGYGGVGTVVAIGTGVKELNVGDSVAYWAMNYGSYAEYKCFPAKDAHQVPSVEPEYAVLLFSGLLSLMGLKMFGNLTKGAKVLVTAASGGPGHIVVQLAKKADCHVIGLCSTPEKEKFLLDLGCDHVINYKKEELAVVLAKRYPDGIDVIWDTVGGSTLKTCLKHISVRGRYLLVGGTSGYQREGKKAFLPSAESDEILLETIFYRSVSFFGINFDYYVDDFKKYFQQLVDMFLKGEIKACYCLGDGNIDFFGMEGILLAVEYQFKREHTGKVLAQIS